MGRIDRGARDVKIGMFSGAATFLATWVYCAATYGFLFGFGLGWLPAAILGVIFGFAMLLAWQLALAAAIVVVALIALNY